MLTHIGASLKPSDTQSEGACYPNREVFIFLGEAPKHLVWMRYQVNPDHASINGHWIDTAFYSLHRPARTLEGDLILSLCGHLTTSFNYSFAVRVQLRRDQRIFHLHNHK